VTIRLLSSPADIARYDSWLRTQPDGTLWQSQAWKTYQESLGRKTRLYVAEEKGEIAAGALVIIDRTSFGLSTWEIPRGPVGGMKNEKLIMENDLIYRIRDDAKKENCISIYFSPLQQFSILNSPFSISHRLIHPEATRILDLTLDDDALLAQMKPKGRYNIRLAEKHGVIVKQSDDIDAYAHLAAETAQRDHFKGRGKNAYKKFLQSLPGAFLLLAYAPDDVKTPLAGLLGVTWGKTGIYYYGASSAQKRECMAPYLLQWEAMRLCRNKGCTSYDLFGIAPEGATNHPWSSVSDFKAKFGGTVLTYPPEREIILRPILKTVLQIKRKILG
jgi:lipid II:glycine glycyltransferase (peptidoglycan interpeptide bridge formation enzyme)